MNNQGTSFINDWHSSYVAPTERKYSTRNMLKHIKYGLIAVAIVLILAGIETIVYLA